MAETSSLLNCRRGNSTASSNLVLSAFEQPTTQVAGCFVVGEHQACLSAHPQQNNRVIAQQSAVQRLRPRGGAQDARANASESCRPRCSRTPLLTPPPLLASSPSIPHSFTKTHPFLGKTIVVLDKIWEISVTFVASNQKEDK